MKPFVLEDALKGAKLVTRSGLPANEFKKMTDDTDIIFPFWATLGVGIRYYNGNGEYENRDFPANDLFMADTEPEKQEVKPVKEEKFSQIHDTQYDMAFNLGKLDALIKGLSLGENCYDKAKECIDNIKAYNKDLFLLITEIKHNER